MGSHSSGMIRVAAIFLTLTLFAGHHGLPAPPASHPLCLNCGPVAERLTEAEEDGKDAAAPAGGEVDLLEDEDEAAGDRIMNGMNEKFDIALKRIGDEIDKDQKEQEEKGAIE